jgi:hypothetical protein
VCEADHSSRSGARVKHGRAISPLPHKSSLCNAQSVKDGTTLPLPYRTVSNDEINAVFIFDEK